MSIRRVVRPSVLRHVPLDRHAVIEASAGTGKTFALEHLVVELVLAGDVPIDRVLIVTFTEKATNELRVRLRSKLEELHRGGGEAPDDTQLRAGDFWTIDDAAQAKLARALHAFDGATIATIHAFCQRVLRENAFASGRLFDEQQVDGRDAFSRALRDALRKVVARDPVRKPWLEAALRTGWSVARIDDLMWRCVQAHGELRPAFDPAALDAAIAAFPVDDARRLDGRDAMRSWGMPHQTARKMGAQLYELALAVERSRDTRSAPELLASTQEVDFGYVAKTLPPYLPRSGPTGAACQAALDLARAAPSLTSALAHATFGPVRDELAARKRAAGQYDFDDMLTLVDHALQGPRGAELVRALRERWRHTLIDEFQDTDETQWSIFRRAFFEVSAGSRSVVTLVGDPKQSIYRFRGADVETYLSARDAVQRSGGVRVALGTSFRATAALVDATNALFDPTAAAPFFSGAIAYEPVTCGRPSRVLVDGQGQPLAPIHALRFERDPPPSVLAARIAREVATITDPARPWRLDGRPLAHQDVFVLTRTGAEGRIVGAALRRAGVPHAFFKEEGLFQTDAARELRTVLWAIDDPTDAARRLAAWLTPYFALPLVEVERARDLSARHPYVARLYAWKALADDRDFEGLFESLVRGSGIVRREILFAEGERELTNTLHLMELLLEHARRTRATLRELVHALSGFIDKSRLPLDLEGNVQRLESERRAVQIMTIHKAKGLEAAVVFLAGGWSAAGEKDVRVYHEGGKRLAWVGKTTAEVRQRILEEEREEDQRLMYVALTRAQGRLVLPCAARDGAPVRLRGAYDAVNRRVVELAARMGELVSVEDVPPGDAVGTPDSSGGGAAPWRPPEPLLVDQDAIAEHARLRERHAGAVVTSYTRMRDARRGGQASWPEEGDRLAEKAEEDVDAAPPVGTLRSARTSGVFVHEVLERVPLASFSVPTFELWRSQPTVSELFDETMAVHRVDPLQREHAQRLVWSAFTTRIDLPGGGALDRLADAPAVVREMQFVFPLRDARVYVRGSLDLAFAHDHKTYFVDWKTDALPSYAPERLAAHVSEHYEDQVRLYALAVGKLLGVRSREQHDARFGGILYVFLRGLEAEGGTAGIWSTRPTWEVAGAWEAALGARRFDGRDP
jgi:exodeoxyribonuclease V beta subunit